MLMMFITIIHWEVKARGTSVKDVGGAGFAGSSPPFLGRERAAVDVWLRERWVLMKIPRGDIDGVGEV